MFCCCCTMIDIRPLGLRLLLLIFNAASKLIPRILSSIDRFRSIIIVLFLVHVSTLDTTKTIVEQLQYSSICRIGLVVDPEVFVSKSGDTIFYIYHIIIILIPKLKLKLMLYHISVSLLFMLFFVLRYAIEDAN